jgi:hypothetical protein
VRCLLVGVLVWTFACQSRNPDWCDGANPCSDGRFCDVTGQSGLKNSCIAMAPADAGRAVDAAVPADAPVPCPDAGACPAAAPICRQGLCTPCRSGTECPISAPVCAGSGSCAACAGDDDCASRSATPLCGPGGVCVACRSSDDCSSLAAPHCQAGVCGACTVEDDCAKRAGTTHCGAGGACVECRTSDDCPATRPVCDAQATCQPCRQDTDCPDLCDEETGACVAASDILFVGLGQTGDCSRAAPCGLIGTALAKVTAAKKWWIVVGPGAYSEALTIKGAEVEIVGPGATVVPRLVADNTPGALVQAGAIVTFRGLRFSGASGGSSADGVLCDGAIGQLTRVTLREVKLDGNDHQGLDALNCGVVLERSLVTKNLAGGVALFSCDFELTNNFIVANGLTTAPFGGVEIDRDPPSGTGTLLFNTIANNAPPGVKCSDQVQALAFADDIVFGNGAMAQVLNSGASCGFSYSAIGPMKFPGMGNLESDPKFVNAQADDYDLRPDSPCVNAADPAATVSVDFYGHPRPAGGRADIGADEAR